MIKLTLSNTKLTFRQGSIPNRVLEYIGLGAIIILALNLLNLSWRKWCDPQIDYGRELYIPWRMSQGALWLKNIDDLYGPLSRFIDVALFRVFGPGIMVLAWANIVIYFGIITLIYLIFKRAWGVTAALASLFVFVGVFSFSQLTITSNYNFVTPYSQQVTHGFLVCLVLLWLIPEWVKASTIKRSFWVGFMVGLTAVLKPEFILTSVLILAFAFFYHVKIRGIPSSKSILAGFLGCVLPTLVFFVIFTTYLPLKQAGTAACYAWLNGVFIWKDELYGHLLNSFSGMDQPKLHLIDHTLATGWALLVIGFIAAASLCSVSTQLRAVKIPLVIVTAFSVAAIGLKGIIWSNVGQCLLGLLLIYALFRVFREIRFKSESGVENKSIERTLVGVLALALMSRMVLNGRIFQYGFIQASLASLVIVAVLIEELPMLIRLKGYGLAVFRLGVSILLGCGVSSIINQSRNLEAAKTLAIGSGKDLFYSYPQSVSGDGEIVKRFTESLSQLPNNQTLVVIPEGIMINYLARKKSPVVVQAFYTNRQIEGGLVNEMEKSKPNWILFMTRDLTEYGVTKYGTKGQSGELIISWVNNYYHMNSSYGQDPIKGVGAGAMLYQLNDKN